MGDLSVARPHPPQRGTIITVRLNKYMMDKSLQRDTKIQVTKFNSPNKSIGGTKNYYEGIHNKLKYRRLKGIPYKKLEE